MKIILFILEKEFKQIFRNKAMLPIIFIAPMIQLMILSFAVDYEIKNINLTIVDHDKSQLSEMLFNKFEGSDYFNINSISNTDEDAIRQIEKGAVDLVLIIGQDFEKTLYTESTSEVQILINAIDGTKASLASSYASSIILEYNRFILSTFGIRSGISAVSEFKQCNVEYAFWYNPELNYKTYMVPGILVLLVTMIGTFLSSMNVVREKELGTIEQLNVTPIKKYQFIIGKTLPLWIIGLFELTIGLILAKLVFHIPFLGNIFTLYAFAGVYLILVIGIGLFISTLADTQQQAMFLSWFFLVIFILLGGLFTAIENMPLWAQKITYLNPIRYFIEVIRMVLLKGAGIFEIRQQFLTLCMYTVIIFTLAIRRYHKVS